MKRFGRKKQPFYRVVIAHSPNARDGETIENVGLYDPTKNPVVLELNKDRVQYWLSVGAQPTDTVGRLLGSEGLIKKIEKVPVQPGVTKKQKKESAGK